MNRRKILSLGVVAAFLLLIGTTVAISPVAAQTDSNETVTTTEPDYIDRMDNNTVLVNKSYNEDTQILSLTFHSERLQEITLTDSGAFLTNSDINRRTVTMRPGETATFQIEVTEVRSLVGVSVATPENLRGVVHELDTFQMFPNGASWTTVQVAGAFGFFGSFFAFVGLGYAKVHLGRKEVERIA